MTFEGEIFFDDQGEPVPVSDIGADSPADNFEDWCLAWQIPVDEIANAKALARAMVHSERSDELRDSSAWLLQALRLMSARGANREQIGGRVLMLLFLLGDFKTMSELARRMGVSPQRTHQALERFRADHPMFSAFF